MKFTAKFAPAGFALLVCTLLMPTGCKPRNPPPTTPRTSSQSVDPGVGLQLVSRGKRSRPDKGSQPGDFDFYLLNLSWSPQFCVTHRDNPQCATHPGFVVHGLWPQNLDGTYPENCSTAARPADPGAFVGAIPTAALVEHEWAAHGTCSGLTPEEYFASVRRAFRSIRIPAVFTATQAPPRILPPDAILAEFTAANPTFPSGAFALSCGNNYLTAIEACLDKSLHPLACQAVRSCRANVVKITPP